MRFAVYEPGDPAWREVLKRVPHDVYHLPGYARVCATHEQWPVKLAVVTDDSEVLVMPFMRRDLPADAPGCDIAAPYGYPGPVCSSSDLLVQRLLLGELRNGFAALGAVTAFIRCHPFLGVQLSALEGFSDIVVHGDQIYLDLAAISGPIEATFRPGHRQNIVALQAAGFSLRVDAEQDADAFPALYRRNMVRLDAAPYYHFPDAYFDAIRASLADSVHYVAAVAPDGRVASMALVLVCGTIAQYHLSCTEDAFLKMAPSKLSILGMSELCRGLGVSILNLGGGVGGESDSLLKFKEGFSKSRVPFATARMVLDERRYAELSTGVDAPSGFFPAYRTGL